MQEWTYSYTDGSLNNHEEGQDTGSVCTTLA